MQEKQSVSLHKLKLAGKKQGLALFLLSIYLLLGLLQIILYRTVVWDEAVYIAMGKYIYSGGNSGYFETLRPIGLPLITGIIWKTGVNYLFILRIIALLFSLGLLYLTYLLGRDYYGERTGIIAMVLVSIAPSFFLNSVNILTDIPSSFFAILAVYTYLRGKLYLAGACSALAFVFRFPSGLILATIIIALALNHKSKAISKIGEVIFGFSVIVIPYLILNFFLFRQSYPLHIAPLAPVLEALWSQGNMAESVINGSIISYAYNWFFYPVNLVIQNPALIFLALVPFYRGIIKGNRKIFLLSTLLFVAYYTAILNKQVRFIFVFLPFAAILAVSAAMELGKTLIGSRRAALYLVLCFALALPLPELYRYAYEDKESTEEVASGLVQLLNGYHGEVMTTIPMPAAYLDNRMRANFVSSRKIIEEFNTDETAEILIYSNDSFWCPGNDAMCEAEKKASTDYLTKNYRAIYKGVLNNKEFMVFRKDSAMQ